MSYLVLKALHIIFVVCWFAGLFYLGRLFIYFKEAENLKNEVQKILQKQYLIMTKRLMYIITWPSTILTTIFGWNMIYQNSMLLTLEWMKMKLLFVFILIIYTIISQILLNQMSAGKIKFSDKILRIWNELATLLLISIVFLAVLKIQISWFYAILYFVAITLVLLGLIKIYKKFYLKK